MVVRADLNGHLKALKDYFLLEKGDFFQVKNVQNLISLLQLCNMFFNKYLLPSQCFLEESRQLMRLPPRQSTAEADLMVPFQLV